MVAYECSQLQVKKTWPKYKEISAIITMSLVF